MMKRYGRVESGIVAEVFETSGDIAKMFHPDIQWISISNEVEAGWTYDGKTFSKPEEVILEFKPTTCTPAQGLVSLFALKKITEDDVQAAIDSLEDPVQKYTAQIAFKRAVTWDRNSQTMQTMAQLLALSEKDLDELFEYAVTIQA